MLIRDLFQAKVDRDIPPVVYFHEDDPARLESEVSEYIITGGYPGNDQRARRVKQGIHEQYVHLLRAIREETAKTGGPELPGCWISGFYGSGKSSFAKLLGLGLDGRTVASGRQLSDLLLDRDTSPKRQELRDAWQALTAVCDPISVVFDIGSVARDNEHIHSAAVRRLRARLGYCSTSSVVAAHELRLEIDEEWATFLARAAETLGSPWSEMKDRQQADDHFSQVLHVMHPGRYPDPMSWFDSRAGSQLGEGAAVTEAVSEIEAMLSIRAPGKTLFLVIDEVSQYVHGDETRMLKLQAFVSELGKRLKGGAWLLVTGQQKLEDAADAEVLGKLKDRFPPRLRVHLSATNIRDVVHRRLLQKKPGQERMLRDLFQAHRADLQLHAFDCHEITEEDFVEIYPMLPGHIDLLLLITTNLRSRSSRVQGDSHAIRGLLQLLGELFREQKLADREVGELVTLDAIYEVLHTALDADVQNTMARILEYCDVHRDETAARAARAVALLELIADQRPTTGELVASCLYHRVGQGSSRKDVEQALERLRAETLLGYTEKQGYKIQSSTGQEWQKERDGLGVTQEQMGAEVQEALGHLMAEVDRPRLAGRPFSWKLLYSDGRHAEDILIGKDGAITVDFRNVAMEERRSAGWSRRSDEGKLRDRLIWVVGDKGQLEDVARRLGKSRAMMRRYQSRRSSLSPEKQRLLLEEEANTEDLEVELRRTVAEAFLHGTIYFRGQPIVPRDEAGGFAAAIHVIAERLLPVVYDRFSDIAVTETELMQLLVTPLRGPSMKFLDKGLGILSLDAGKYFASCEGQVPSRVLTVISEAKGISGSSLLSSFSAPPYGYAPDVVKACVAGLLHGGKIRIRPEGGEEMTSVNDPGVAELFRKDRDFKRADFFPGSSGGIGPRDLVAICKFFKERLDADVERDKDSVADAVYRHFPRQRERLRSIEARLLRLPEHPGLPPALERLGKALEDCRRSRAVEKTVVSVLRNLDALRDGIEQLALYDSELTDDVALVIATAHRMLHGQYDQLAVVGAGADLEAAAMVLRRHLGDERPWRSLPEIVGILDAIDKGYTAARRALLGSQEHDAEAAKDRVKSRHGFERLDTDAVHRVLRPLSQAIWDTTDDAVAPSLAQLRDQFPARLRAAEEESNELLDRELEKLDEQVVVKVPLSLRGRELTEPDQLDALLGEIRDRALPLLRDGKRVRFV